MAKGAIVRSVCGRDRKRLFVIVDICDDGRVLVADGKLHKLSCPKKKNLRHIKVLAAENEEVTSLCESGDEALGKFLWEFEENLENHQ
ncbi:MAG: KOW domain-containing RNA-binding protein [Clostridia bacterium]|nr:KOW domain-containing RNA-binding protein [Clostridia bacterium]